MQVVLWSIIREKFANSEIRVWTYVKNGTQYIFASKANEVPYVVYATNINSLNPLDMRSEHPLVVEIKKAADDSTPSNSSHVALKHNGLAWEIVGKAQKVSNAGVISLDKMSAKAASSEGQDHEQPEQQPPSKPKKTPSPSKPKKAAASQELPQATMGYTVNHTVTVKKLPNGENLVTMTRPDQPTIQIKLPLTNKNQHWCTIKVDGREGSVQCPDSPLALKVNVLKQASTLAAKEKTTVRIPLGIANEVPNFGVYAVPGLQSHVFVGPFTEKEPKAASSKPAGDDDDIICLSGDESPKKSAPSAQEATADANAGNSPMDGDIVAKNIAIETVSPEPLDKKAKLKIRHQAIMGQVPQKVVKASGSSIDKPVDVDMEDVDDKDEEEAMKRVNYKPPYLNPATSEHGRVVFNPEPNRHLFYEQSDDNKLVWLNVEGYGKVKVFVGPGSASFMHPDYKDHEVFCDNLNQAKLWVENYLKTKMDHGSPTQEQKTESSTSPKAADTKPKSGGLVLKPLASLMEKASKASTNPGLPPELIKNADAIGKATEREINGRKFVSHPVLHNGRRGVAIVFDRRHHNDMRMLYFKLNQLLATNGLRKMFSCVQILQRAKDEIYRLQKLDEDFTKRRKALMMRRSSLFKSFTDKLDGMPTAEKKAAVLALKDGLKKSKEAKNVQQQLVTTKQPALESTSCDIMFPQIDTGSNLMPKHAEAMHPLKDLMPATAMSNPTLPSSATPGITPYSDVTGLQTVKKDGKVLRPMNAFMLWSKSYRKELISKG